MKNTNILAIVITLAVGIILMGSLLAPVLSNAEKTIGAPVSYSNLGHGYTLDIMDSAELTATSTGTAGQETYVINGVEAEPLTGNNLPAIITDSFAVQIAAPGNNNLLVLRSGSGNNFISTLTTSSVTIECQNGTATIDIDGTESTFTYEWMLAISANGKYIESNTGAKSVYFEEGQTPIFYGYNNTIGYYTYFDGDAEASAATVTVTYSQNLVSGTTDVYLTTSDNPSIGGITPGATIVPIKVTGHANDGATAITAAILPIMIIALVIMAIGAVFRNRDD